MPLTVALIAAALLAYLFPQLGDTDGPLRPELTTKLAVTLIFLLQGLTLPTRKLLHSARRLKVHAYCLAANFLIAPLLMLGILELVGDSLPTDLANAFLYLAFLPTTISSAIVMTSNSRGDSSTALFACAFSNILGIFLTPLLCILFIPTLAHGSLPLLPTLQKLSLLILLPLVIGQLLRPLARETFDRLHPRFKTLSTALVVYIVFIAFCHSVTGQAWSSLSLPDLLKTIGLVLLFLAVLSIAIWRWSTIPTSDLPERIACFFCGSQKTLAAGVPMAAILFASQAESLGILLLPLMLFHPLQLVLGAALTPRFASLANKESGNQPAS